MHYGYLIIQTATNMKKKNNHQFNLVIHAEYVFLLVALLFGVLFALLNPPAQSNDEDRHFYNAYAKSEGNFLPEKKGDNIGYYLPKSILRTISSYQGINFFSGAKIKKESIDNFAKIELNEKDREFYNHPNYSINPIPYLPYAIGINIGNIFNDNPMSALWSARISGLIFYIIIIFLSIRIIPIFKNVLMLLSLSPMALYQASSVTYDVMAISLSYLLLAIVIYFATVDQKINIYNVLIFLIIAIFHRFAKDGYFLIPYIIFIISPSKFDKSYYFWLILFSLIIIYFLPGWTWNNLLSSSGFVGGVPLQNDFLFNTGKNISFHLEHPFSLVKHLFFNILSQGSEWLYGSLGRFGYAYAIPSKLVLTLHAIVLITVSLFDSNNKIELSKKLRYSTFLFGITMMLIVIGGYLIMGSPVGSYQVFGFQGRYLIPILPFVFFVLYNTQYYNERFFKFGSLAVGLYSIIILSYISVFINNYFYSAN